MSITRKLGNRFYNYYIPSSPQKDSNGLVFVFHGGGSNPAAVEWESEYFSTYADKYGFTVVFPAGTNDRIFIKNKYLYWNDGRPRTDGSYSTSDDVKFVKDIIKDISNLTTIDPTKVFAAGYSNGAQFCCRLAQQLSDKITAIACVASARRPDDIFPLPPRKISAMFIKGEQDPIIPYDGGEPTVDGFAGIVDPWPNIVATWEDFNDCNFVDKEYLNKTEFIKSKSLKGIKVYSLRSPNGGHTWPGGRREKVMLGYLSKDYIAAKVISEFFFGVDNVG